MISASEFLEPARQRGFDFWAGVPCSYLKPFINYIIDDAGLTYVSSANEGDAVATATGAALAGRRSVAMMQNSGLGNAVSPLSSLNWVFRIPVLLIVTLRGDAAHADEPQHELMGQITAEMLEQLQIPWQWFPDSAGQVDSALDTATAHMDATGRPYAFIMRKGTVSPYQLQSVPGDSARPAAALPPAGLAAMMNPPSRHQALTALVAATDENNTVVIATTGFTGRELYAIADRANHLYVVGSMGCASSLALGLAMVRPDLKVVVADGDGAALMRLGNLATVGRYAGPNFYQVLLDNHMHESTGGQATVSNSVDFATLAAACSFHRVQRGTGVADIDPFLAGGPGPALLHLQTAAGVPDDLPRPSVGPVVVRRRLMEHIAAEAAWRDLAG